MKKEGTGLVFKMIEKKVRRVKQINMVTILLFYLMEMHRGILSFNSKLYEIIISPNIKQLLPNKQLLLQIGQTYQMPSAYSAQTCEKLKRIKDELTEMGTRLQKEKELTYIMKGYFAKIEKIMYNKESHLFENELDYQKVELHMREIVRRLTDFHNQKLNSIPVIYRNNNVKVYRHPPNTPQK